MSVLFVASGFAGAVTFAAAIDAGRFPDGHRVLLVVDTSAVPESRAPLHLRPGGAALIARFDEVVDWNETIRPLHPASWTPRPEDVPLLARLFAPRFDEVTGIVLDAAPGAATRPLLDLVPDRPVTVVATDLSAYGPTPTPLPTELGERVTDLLHLDVEPGLSPLLLHEFGPSTDTLPVEAVRAVLDEVTDAYAGELTLLRAHPGAPLIIGHDLGLEDAGRRHVEMLAGLIARGPDHVLVAPQGVPLAPLQEAAVAAGVGLTVVPDDVPVEVVLAALRPPLVVGTAPPALSWARALGLPVATVGGVAVLDAITPYQDATRIPATITDLTVPSLTTDGRLVDPPVADVPAVVGTVAYLMRAGLVPHLRDVAAAHLAVHGTGRWFRLRRAQALNLPTGPHALRSRIVGRLRRAIGR